MDFSDDDDAPYGICDDCRKPYDVPDSGYRLFCKPCQRKRATHPQVESGFGFLVDEEIQPLVALCNARGFTTINSCQESGSDSRKLRGKAWIMFDDDDDQAHLLRCSAGHRLLNWLTDPKECVWITHRADDDDDFDWVSLFFSRSRIGWFEHELRAALESVKQIRPIRRRSTTL